MRSRLLIMTLLCALLLSTVVRAEPPADEQTVLQELFSLGRSLQETRATLAEVTAKVDALARQQAEAAAERDRLETRRQQRQAAFYKRLRFYQEHGRVAPLAVLLGSTSFLDFLSRLDMLNQILDRDVALMRELRSLKSAVAEQEQALREAGRQLEPLRAKLAAEAAKLQDEIARREAVLASLQEKRGAVEEQLAQLERSWAEQAEPLLIALGTTLQSVDASSFEPDRVSLTLFPPGAVAVVTTDSLTRFFRQVDALKGLTFKLQPGVLRMEGEFDGVPIQIRGRFTVAGPATLRYEPQEIQIREFVVPPESIAELLAENQPEIDVSDMISPWALKGVDVLEGELRIKAGIK
ncbi:MAG TPA: hypothetical protein VNT75_21625 [Symbiobacteriaceae bacterium]|nr:hypothetical protein [Symbiobacteriaceae bacterium]